MLLNIFFITFFIYFSFREQYQSINLPSFPRTQSNQIIVLFSKLSRRQLLILIYIYDEKDTFKVHPCNKNIYNQHNESINREKYHVSIDVLTWLRTRYFESNVRHAHNFFSINFKILLQFFVLSKKIPPPPQKSIITNLISPRNTNSTPFPPFPSTFERLNARIKSPFRKALKSAALKRHVAVANVVQPIDPRTR